MTDVPPPPDGAARHPAAFTTARLAIDPLSMTHAAGLHAALDHPEVARFLPVPDVTTLDALRARIERLAAHAPPAGERWWNFAVLLRADRTVIGRLEATTYGDWGEIAYVFGPRWWGQDLASEAAAWLVRHVADQGSRELWAAVHPANTASQRLLARAGFRRAPPARPLASFDPGDDAFVRRQSSVAATRTASAAMAKRSIRRAT